MKLQIHNLNWQVEFIQSEHCFEENNTQEELCGITKKLKLQVFINSEMNDDLVRRTVIHELTHAYIWTYGFENFDSFKEEDLCNFIETFSESILKDTEKVMTEYESFKGKFDEVFEKVENIIETL